MDLLVEVGRAVVAPRNKVLHEGKIGLSRGVFTRGAFLCADQGRFLKSIPRFINLLHDLLADGAAGCDQGPYDDQYPSYPILSHDLLSPPLIVSPSFSFYFFKTCFSGRFSAPQENTSLFEIVFGKSVLGNL